MTWAVVEPMPGSASSVPTSTRRPSSPAAEPVEHLGGPPEGPDAVGRRPAPLQLERDPPQRLHWVILHWVILHRVHLRLIPRWRQLGRRCGQGAVVEVLQQDFRAILEV